MASALQKLLIPIFGDCSLSFPLLKHFIEDSPPLSKFNDVSYSAYKQVKFCSYNPSSNFSIYLWNGVLLFQQPLHNHYARLLQLFNKHLAQMVTTLSQPYKVVARLLQPSYFCMRFDCYEYNYSLIAHKCM